MFTKSLIRRNHGLCDHPQFSDETTSYNDPSPPPIFYKDSKTCVFWDVDDYPIRNGLDPASIYQRFREAIGKQLGYRGEVTIHAYADTNTATFSEGEFSDAGFKFEVVTEGGKNTRFLSMYAEILLWTLENPAPANIIILAQIPEDGAMSYIPLNLTSLITCGRYGVFLSDSPQKCRFPGASFLTSALGGSRASRRKQKLADSTSLAAAEADLADSEV